MAAFDFPSSPSVNQTYTANGVTWKWNGTMWMRITGAGYLEKIEEGNSKIEVDDSGSGNVTVTTDGTERLRVTSAGDMGLGTNSPNQKLHLHAAGSGGNKIKFTNDTTATGASDGFTVGIDGSENAELRLDEATNMLFVTNSTERLRITSGGSVAIGVNSPSDKLHVGGNNAFIRVDRPNGNPGLTLIYNSTNSTRADIDVTTGGDLRFATNNSTERLRITSTGIVQLATDAVDFANGTGYITAKGSGDLIFRTTNSYTERLRITSAGYVGINNNTPPVRLAIQDTTNCKLLLSSSWSGTQEIIFGGGSASSTGASNNTAAKIIAQASAPGGAATGYLSFYTNTGDNIYERLRLTPEGNIWTVNSSIMHGSGDISNFANAGRTSNNNISIRAGNPSAGTSPANSNSAIKIYPAGVRSATTGNLTGGIAWQHLDPDNGTWDSSYGAGSQIWMGAALHDTPGQERDRFNLWMNSQTTGNSQPNNLAIEAYPNGIVRHPKVPAFMVRNSTNSGAFSAEARATWNVTILNNGSHFDMSNNVFTAPVDGIYSFSCMMLSQNNTRLFHNFRVNNTIVEGTRSESYSGTSYQTNTITMVYSLSANDYVDVYVRTNNAYGGFYTNFNGFLVG